MENGEWRMENGEWRMENGEWRMENGEWRMENGEWRMENGYRRDTACLVQHSRHVGRVSLALPFSILNFQLIYYCSTLLSSMVIMDAIFRAPAAVKCVPSSATHESWFLLICAQSIIRVFLFEADSSFIIEFATL
jgi:hypothetical protein